MSRERLSRRLRPRKRLKFLLFAQLSCSGCFSATPFQSARVVEPGQRAGSMSFQRSEPRDPEEEQGYTMIEGGTRIPLGGGRADLGLNGAFVAFDAPAGSRQGYGGLMFGMGLKLEVVEDVLAVELPARVTFLGTATFHTTHFYPRAILSLPVGDHLEVNLSATRFFFPTATGDSPWGYSAGLAIGERGGAIFRPEIGVLDYPEGGDMLQFGIAYTPEFGEPAHAGSDHERTPH